MPSNTDTSGSARAAKLRRISAARGPIPVIRPNIGSQALDAVLGKGDCCDSYVSPSAKTPLIVISPITTPPPFATPDQVPDVNALINEANRFLSGTTFLRRRSTSFSLAAFLFAASMAPNLYAQLNVVPSQTLTYKDSVSLMIALRTLPGKTVGDIELPIYVAIPSNKRLPEPPSSGSYFAAVNSTINATYTYENSADTLNVTNGVQVFQSATLGDTTLILGGSYTLICTDYIYTLNINYLGSHNSNISRLPVLAPSPPSNITVSPGNASATLNFTADYDGRIPITTYLYSVNGGGYIDSKRSTAPITITGLANGVNHTIRLKAVNRVGPSDPSVSVTVTPSNNIPPPLTSVSYALGTPGTIDVTIVYGNGNQLCNYVVEGGGSGKIVGTTGTIALYTGATFVIYFAAENSDGSGPQTILTVTIPKFISNPPTNLSALASNGATILTFVPGFDGGSPITTYLYSANGSPYKDTNQSKAPLTITGLTNNVPYEITLKTVTAAGPSLPSAPVTVTPIDEAPLPLKAVSLTAGSTPGTINVSVVYSDGSQTYRYISDILGTGEINGTTGTIQAFSGQTFVISLAAVNSYGVSSPTSVTISLPATAPAPPQIILPIFNSDSSASIAYNETRNGNPTTAVLYSFDGFNYRNSNQTTSPVTIRGLVNGQIYSAVYLKLENSIGASAPSAPFTLAPFGGAPVGFTNVVAKPGYAQATVSFTAPPGVIAFLYAIDSGMFQAFYTNPYTITGLVNDRINTIHLMAVGADNTNVSTTVTVDVTPSSYIMAPPHALTGYNSASSAIITFSQYPLQNPVISYMYSLDGGKSYIDSNQSTSPLVINALENDKSYKIILAVKTIAGVSDPSSPIDVTPTSGAPASLTNIKALPGSGEADISFTPPSGITKFLYSIDGISFGVFYTTYITIPLNNGITYTIYLAAVANNNSISRIETVQVTPTATIINPPDILHGYGSVASAIIAFEQTANLSPVTDYLYSVDGGLSYTSSGKTTSPLTINGLTNGQPYTITLKTVIDGGNMSGASNSINVTPSSIAPASLTNITPTPGNREATVEFTAPPNINAFIYSINGKNFTPFYENPYIIANLTNSINYTISLAAVGIDGSISSIESVQVTPSSNIISAPSEIKGYGSLGSAIITFKQGATTSSVTNYLYSLNRGPYTSSGQLTSPLRISGLTNGTPYTITLKTEIDGGKMSAPSPSIIVTPSSNAPAPVTNVTATPGNAEADILFTLPSGITNFLYSIDGINFYPFSTSSDAIPSFTIPSLYNGTEYTISLAAVASDFNSISSIETVKVTPSSIVINPPDNLLVYNSFESVIITFNQSVTPTPVTSYLYSLNGGAYIDSLKSASPLTITGLTNGTPYTIILKTKIQGGRMSDPSPSIDVTPSSNAPASLTDIVAIAGYKQASIGFNANGSTDFHYSSDGINFNNFYTNPFVIDGLANDSAYTFYIGAFSLNDQSISNLEKITVTPSSSIVNLPDTLSVIGSFNSAFITFNQGETTSPVTDYEYSLDGTPYVTSGQSSSPLKIPLPVVELFPDTFKEYEITLRAVTADGKSDPSMSVKVTPSKYFTDILTDVNVTPGYGEVSVDFTAPSGSDYFMYYTNGPNFGPYFNPFTDNPFLIMPLDNGITYTIYLAVVNPMDNSISDLVSVSATSTEP